MYYLHHYVIDWEKVQSLDDMKRLLAAMQIAFERDHKSIESIKDLVQLEPKGSPIATMD